MTSDRYRQACQRLDRLRQLSQRYNLGHNPEIRNWLFHLEQSPTDDDLAEHVETLIENKKDNPFLQTAAPSSPEELYGPGGKPDFRIGQTTLTGVEYGPRFIKDTSNILLSGVGGGGKSTILTHIQKGLFYHHPTVGQIVFDLKNECSSLALLPLHRVNVHPHTELRFNFFRPPPGILLTAWLTIVATTLCVFRGLVKSRHILTELMFELCRTFGVDRDPNRPWPTFYNLVELIRTQPKSAFDKLGQYQASLLNELSGFLRDAGDVINTCDGLPLSELARPGIFVIQLKNLHLSVQQILISLISVYHIIAQDALGKMNVPMRVCIMIDEAQLVLSNSTDFDSPGGLTPLAIQLLQARSSGVCFIVVCHILTRISEAILSNAKTFGIVGSLSDTHNARLAAGMMHLPPAAFPLVTRMPTGLMLVRELGKPGDFKESFLVDVDAPPPELDKNAIDEKTRCDLMAFKRAAFPATPAKSLSEYTRIDVDFADESPVPPTPAGTPTPATATSKPAPTPTDRGLDQEQMDIVMDVVRHWDDFVAIRCKRMKVKDYQRFKRRVLDLEINGFLVQHKMAIGSKTPLFLEATELAWLTVGKKRPSDYCGKGDFTHAVMGRLTEKNRKDFHWHHCKREFPIGDKHHLVDLFCVDPSDNRAYGYEITLNTSNVVDNAINSLTGSNLHHLVFLCCTQDEAQKVESLLKADPRVAPLMDKISCECLDKYIF